MADRKNPYLDLIDDESVPAPAQRQPEPQVTMPEPSVGDGQASNVYLDLIDDDIARHDMSKSLIGGAFGGAGGYLSTGAGLHPTRPPASFVAGSKMTPVVESLMGAPAGAVSDVYRAMQPQGSQLSSAARAAVEARIPQVEALPPAAPATVPSASSGERWAANWAGQERPGFTGGVPEAAQAYQRGKSSGKIISRMEKKGLTNVWDKLAQSKAQEAEAAAKVRADLYAHEMRQAAERRVAQEAARRAAAVAQQTQATESAAKVAAPMSVLGRVLTGAGIGLGGYDAYRRMQEGDKTGAGLTAGATALGTAFPMLAPLSAAGMALYDDPEARKRFLEAMKPGGAWQQRMEGRFGLD